jgi:type II secretory pathway component PulF
MGQELPTRGRAIARAFGALAIHFFAFVVVLAVFVFVVPEHARVAQKAGIDLLPLARLFVGMSYIVLQYWYFLVIGFLLADGLVVTWFAWWGWWKALTLFNYAVLMGSLLLVLLVSMCLTAPLQFL